jgi:hypothetical protein
LGKKSFMNELIPAIRSILSFSKNSLLTEVELLQRLLNNFLTQRPFFHQSLPGWPVNNSLIYTSFFGNMAAVSLHHKIRICLYML